MTLDPNAEFAAEPVTPEATPAPAPVPSVTPAELAEVRTELNEKLAEIAELRSKTDIMDKLKEVFTGKSGDPKDAYVRSEIQRLVPELDDVAKIKQLLPVVMETLGAAAEEKLQEKAGSAVELMRGLMTDAGLDGKDDETVGYMEEVLTREIKANPELLKLWNRGNIKGAVSKAFEKASSKLIAPIRAKAKAGAVRTITESPRPMPRGAAPSPAAATNTVDHSDTSRDGRNKVHDAAFDRLQELLDR